MIKKSLGYHSFSFLIHFIVFALFYVYTRVFDPSFSPTDVDKSKLRIVGKAIKVDVVAMPRFTIKELQTMDNAAPGKSDNTPKAKSKAENKGGDENTVFKKSVKKPSLSERLKQLSQRNVKKEKIRKRVKKTKKKQTGNDGISGTRLKKILALGNQLSQGEALTGDNVGNSGDLFDQYAILITDLVRSKWTLPAYLADKDLRCTIQVFISKTGKLIRTNKITSSGNSDYDEYALSAIMKVGKFPAPDKNIATRVLSGEIALAFPL